MEQLDPAQVILLSTQLAAKANVTGLARLRSLHTTVLHVELVLRIILTFLPESTDVEQYLPFVQNITTNSSSTTIAEHEVEVDISSVSELDPAVIRQQVKRLRLLPLRYPDSPDDAPNDALVSFVIHRAHRIDSESGLQPLILQLVGPFVEQHAYLRTWLISTILPLLRFNYEYYQAHATELDLDTFEAFDAATAINSLLSKSDSMHVARDLRGLVGPWMYGGNSSKRRKLSRSQDEGGDGWKEVNEWLVSTSVDDFDTTVHAIKSWNGPGDEDLGSYAGNDATQKGTEPERILAYSQAGLAAIYATTSDAASTHEGSVAILDRVAGFCSLEKPAAAVSQSLQDLHLNLGSFNGIVPSSLTYISYLSPQNVLSVPSQTSLDFGAAVVSSASILRSLHYPMSVRAVTETCLFGSVERQQLCLQKVLSGLEQHQKTVDWIEVRMQLCWMRNWRLDITSSPDEFHGMFWRVGRRFMETELLKALLNASQYDMIAHVYLHDAESSPLEPADVEDVIQEAIMTAYDNASNGNRNRGGMKRASEILKTFRSYFPGSDGFKHDEALLAATHSLSFYSLTLQHGVPFQPVSIRVHQDPIALIGKVLDQNPKAYTKLDDLLSIGQNLVDAGLPVASHELADRDHDFLHDEHQQDHEQLSLDVSRRITSLAISAALNSDDFGTAYSYVLTRLSPSTSTSNTSSANTDSISYLSAYTAGKHVSPNPPTTRASHISHLQQRMELLSLALTLAPNPSTLPEILATWRRVDEEMSLLRATELEEEEAWDARGDAALSTVPGGFGPSSAELDASEMAARERARRAGSRRRPGAGTGDEEAPMGLFDVARGAAAAFQRSAFPLHGADRNVSISSNTNTTTSHKQGQTSISHSRVPSASSSRFSIGGMPFSVPLSGSGLLGSGSERGAESGNEGEEQERVRKRDVVSNMVTGGLVSGIGWVLGAQPVEKQGER